jgi:hypothetical protein
MNSPEKTSTATLTFGFGAESTNANGGRNHSAVPDLPWVEIATSWADPALETRRYWRTAPLEWETVMGSEIAPNFAEFIEFLFEKHFRFQRKCALKG